MTKEKLEQFKMTALVTIVLQIIALIGMVVFGSLLIIGKIPGKWWIGIILITIGSYIFITGIVICIYSLLKVKEDSDNTKLIKILNIIMWVTLNRTLIWMHLKLKK